MNELKSYTEYAVSTPTADFVIGFDFNYGEDAVNVTVDDVPATTAGYTVVYLNETTIRLSPSVPSGVVRLQRETDIDQTDHAYRAGAKFIAQTMDENFEQLRHSQQEVRDGFSKLKDDIGFTNLEQTIQAVHIIANEVEDNVVQSQILLADTTAQAVLAQDYANSADSANTDAQQAATTAQQAATAVSTAEADVYSALSAQQIAVNNSLTAIAGGHKAYRTLTEAQAAQATLPVNSIVEVTNDAVNNGTYQWNGTTLTKSAYDPLTQAKAYSDGNPLFKVRQLVVGEDINSLRDGIYRIDSSAIGDTLLNMPSDMTPKVGTVFVYRAATVATGIAYQKIIKYTGQSNIEVWERTGNGGTSSFVWYPWIKSVSRYDFDQNNLAIASNINAKAEVNLFPNLKLDSENSTTYQATLVNESAYPTLTMSPSVGVLSYVYYEMPVISGIMDVGNLVTFSAAGFCDTTGANAGDITIQALNSSGGTISTSTTTRIMVSNTWQKLTTTLTLPTGTTKIRFRMINRNGSGNTVCKFRDLSAYSDYPLLKYINPFKASTNQNIYYVAKNGSDSNNGTSSSTPFLTIQKAVDSLPQGGIIEVAGGEYRETITVSTNANLWIRSKRDQRAKILGSDQLVVTKTAGYTQVYQAPLAAKPVGMGGGRGQPVIFEWGTPSKPIIESERHFLQRGHTHRLPYTEMFEATSLAELDTVGGRGKWWWDAGVIYFAATDGSDATLKRYEARVRACMIQSNGSIQLTRIDALFSNSYGMIFSGVHVKREDCRAFGSYHNGFADNANFTESYRDESAGNGNDGFNGTVTSYADATDENTRLESVYFDPYGHDNGDDGLSDHYRGDVTIYGGLFEYNTKADVVHVTGANCVCYNTEVRGTLNGFYAATATTGDSSRVKTVFKCVGTKATGNIYSYRAGDDAVLQCENAKAITPTGYGYYQAGTGYIDAVDCKYTGDPLKMKTGTVNVINNGNLT